MKAVIVPRPDTSVNTEELIDLVKDKKGSHYASKSIDLADARPLAAVGKVDKKVLRANYWSDQDRQVH